MEYRTVQEAEQALQQLHGFDMGNKVCLNVKIAERQEDRQRRLAKKREEEAFLSTLHCGKYESEGHISLEEYEMDEQEVEKALKNPLLPRYNTPPQSDTSHSFACDHTTTSPGPASLASSGGAASLSATPGTYTNGTGLVTSAKEKNVSSFPGSDIQQTPSPEKQQFECTVCRKLTTGKCSRCKAPYCSEKCQKQDWSQHKQTCLPPGTRKNKSESTEPANLSSGEVNGIQVDPREPLKIAEDSDDEGFYISIPGDDDIAAIKDFVQQVRSGDAPSLVSQNDYSSSGASTGSGGHVNSDLRGEKSRMASGLVAQKGESPPTVDQLPQPSSAPHQSQEPDGHGEVQAISPSKHVTFGPPQQQTYSSNPKIGVVVSVVEIMPHFVSPCRPLSSIPLESPLPDEFNAVVTSAISCTRFSVVVLSVEAKQALVKLQMFGKQGPFLPVNPAELTVGSKCGFKDESNGFCRMEVVKKPQGGSIAVKRYDLGGHIMVSVKSLFCLPEEIILIPCLRHRLSLLNLFTSDGVGLELLMRLVGAKPVHVQYHGTKHMTSNVNEKIFLCKIQSLDGEVDIYEVLQNSQLVRRKDMTKVNKDPQASSLIEPRGAAHDQRPIPEVDESPETKELPYRIVHFAHKIPIHQPPREGVFEIIPTAVTSPSVIWAHVAHPNLGVLHRMEKDLNVYHKSSKSDSYAPTVGEICAAKFANDQQFHRVEVLCVNNNGTVEVLYVDFGNRATVTTGQLRYLQPIFLTLPKQAVQFSLADITPCGTALYWSDNAVAYLKGKITSKNVPVEIISETQKAFLVRMFDPDSPKQVLNDTMVSLGHAQYEHTRLGKPPTTPPFSLRGVSVGSAQKKTPPRGSNSRVKQGSPLLPHTTVTNSTPVQDLPMTHPETEKQHHQEELGTANTSAFGQTATFSMESEPITPPLSPTEQDELTSWKGTSPAESMGQSPQWSALLKKDTLPATCKPVDHGTHEPPTPGQSGHADGFPGKTPPWRAAEWQSSGGEVGAAEKNWSPFARTPDSPHGHPVLAKQQSGNVPWAGVTGGRLGTSVSSQEAANILDSSAEFLSRDQGPRSPQKYESGNRREAQLLMRKRIETAQLPSNNEPVQALVSHVESPLEFWVQVADHESIKSLMSIQKNLNSTPVSTYTDPRAGELCVCRYSEDNCLYRGRVVSVENKLLKVQFIDYGNTEMIQLSEVYHIHSDFLDLPAQAICCTLNQLLNPAGRNNPWGKEDVQFFKSHVMGDGVVVNVKPVKSLGMKNIVEVAVETESGERDMLEMMVRSGHGGSVKTSFKMGGGGRGGSNMQQKSPFGGKFKSRPEQQQSDSERGGLKQQRREQPSKSINRRDAPEESGQRQVGKVPFASFRAQPVDTSPSPTTGQAQAKSRVPFATLKTGGAGTNRSQPEDKPERSPSKTPYPLSEEVTAAWQQHQHQYPQVAKMERYRVLNESEYFEVLVTEVEHPQSMFIQVASKDFALGLEELMQSLRAHFESASLPSLSRLPEEGSLCCAKFSQDGAWYRAEVIEVFEMGCKVRFIDFGNVDSVKLSDLAPCPSQLQFIPVMTVHCALNGIAPPKSGPTWPPEATSLLKQKCSDRILQARVVDSARGFPQIELVDTSSEMDVSITEELIKGGLAVSAVSTAHAAPGELSRATAQLDLSAIHTQEPESVSSKSTRVVFPQARLPQEKLFQVQVTDVTNPWWFCVQEMDRDNLAALNSLMEELQKAYLNTSQHGHFEVQVGAPCCAQYAADECWYRCRVLEEVGGNQVKLRYVDFGNVECESLTKVYPLDSKFTQLPSLGVTCSLSAVKPVSETGWSSEAVQKFTSLVSGGSGDITFLTARVVSESVSGATQIELFSDDNGVNSVADVLVQGQYASHDPARNSPNVTQLPSGQASTPEVATESRFTSQSPSNRTSLQLTSPDSPLASLPCVALPSSPEFTVMVTHTDSPSSFYIVTAQSVNSMMALMQNLNSYCPSANRFQQPPSRGDFCAASYQDEWFRAQVLKQLTQDTFKIFFFDFGNTETVSLGMMRPLLSEHLSLPAQAVQCGLYGIPAGEAVSPTATVVEAFKSLVSSSNFSCKVLSTYPLLVSLKDTVTGTALSVRDELIQMDLFPQVQDLGLTSLTPGSLPSTDSSVVIVTEITDPSDFWIQVGEITALSELQKMSQKLNEYCMSCSPVKELPVLGQLCCAKFSQDGVWYRARVIEIVTKVSFRVHFVDFGNSEAVGLSDLRPFRSDFMRIPAQAIHCCLVGCKKIVGGAGGGSRGVAEQFKKLVENRQLIGIHRGMCRVDKTTVELVDTNGDTDVYIHAELKDRC